MKILIEQKFSDGFSFVNNKKKLQNLFYKYFKWTNGCYTTSIEISSDLLIN